MPRIINEPVMFPGRGKPGAIDWGSLTDGRAYRLIFGEDFSGKQTCVQSSAHQAATRRGLRVRTTRQGNDVIVQFYSPEDKANRQRRVEKRSRQRC